MASFVALQPHYNLVERDYEDELMGVCERNGLACFPYFGLARGFLTGKYRPGARVESPRAAGIEDRYLNDRGFAVLAVLDEVAAAHAVAPAAVALAWLLARPTVVAPLASATSTEQLAQLLAATSLELSAQEVERLSGCLESPRSRNATS